MRRLLVLLLLVLAFAPVGARAAVRISFYSHDFGEYFPHGFIVLRGSINSTGGYVDENFGWTSTAANVILAVGERLPGVVSNSSADYVRKSTEEFSFYLTDDEYAAVRARIKAWSDLPQPSYSLASANCVYFIADMARAAGLKADPKPGLMLQPKSYLRAVEADNAARIAARADPPPIAPGAPRPPPPPPPIAGLLY